MIWILFTCTLILLNGEELEVRLNVTEFQQGQTIRLQVRGVEENCSIVFDEVAYPLYTVNSSKVGLIGIPADFATGSYELRLCEEPTRWKTTIEVKSTSYPRQKIIFPPQKTRLLDLDITDERKIIRTALGKESEKRFWHAIFLQPVEGEITSQFGAKRNGGYHRGLDISAERGTIVRAPAGGTVTVARDFPIHGKTVVLEHGQGISSVYCHLDTILVSEREIVDKSGALGKVGDTGLATAPHLHWGLYVHGVPIDPSFWLSREY